jgi:hypothetical protein
LRAQRGWQTGLSKLPNAEQDKSGVRCKWLTLICDVVNNYPKIDYSKAEFVQDTETNEFNLEIQYLSVGI